MFCTKCGSNNPDSAAFCSGCGAEMPKRQNTPTPQPAPQPAPQPVPQPANSSAGKVILAVILTVVILAGLAVGAYFLFFRDSDSTESSTGSSSVSKTESPEDAAERYMDAYMSLDADGIIDCIHEDVMERIAEEEFDGDLSECIDSLKEVVNDTKKEMKDFIASVELGYDIIDVDELNGAELGEYIEVFEDDYGVKITAAANIELETWTKGEYDGETIDNTNETSILIVKIDGKWYIDPNDVDF